MRIQAITAFLLLLSLSGCTSSQCGSIDWMNWDEDWAWDELHRRAGSNEGKRTVVFPGGIDWQVGYEPPYEGLAPEIHMDGDYPPYVTKLSHFEWQGKEFVYIMYGMHGNREEVYFAVTYRGPLYQEVESKDGKPEYTNREFNTTRGEFIQEATYFLKSALIEEDDEIRRRVGMAIGDFDPHTDISSSYFIEVEVSNATFRFAEVYESHQHNSAWRFEWARGEYSLAIGEGTPYQGVVRIGNFLAYSSITRGNASFSAPDLLSHIREEFQAHGLPEPSFNNLNVHRRGDHLRHAGYGCGL